MIAPVWLLSIVAGCGLTDREPPPLLLERDGPDLVDVAAPREFRGAWIATVFNLDFPSRRGLSPAAGRVELRRMVDALADRGLNALVFQIRAEGDALYTSDLEPWSRFLTGQQGRDPGYDPLELLLEAAHDRGVEVHAWLNPYRAAAKHSEPRHASHISRTEEDHLVRWGATLWLDPGARSVQQRVVDVVADVLSRYDVDGIHLDDYFYPYPRGRTPFPDDRTFDAYRQGGGPLSRSDWRRSNVDSLVERIWSLVRAECPTCRMGISPFGIYRPGHPPGVRGMDQVTALYADPLAWHREGWMDYLAPQLYWPTTQPGQPYGRLLDYWDAQVGLSRPLVVGLDATRAGERDFPLSEYRTQVRLAREAPNTHGQIWFRAAPIVNDKAGLGRLLSELYAEPALPLASRNGAPPAPPTVEPAQGGVWLSHPAQDDVRSFAIYRAATPPSSDVTLERLVAGIDGPSHVELSTGTWVISAVARGALESRGVKVTVE